MDGRLKGFKKGAFRTAAAQGLPILPVTIVGTRDIQRPKSLLIFPGRVRLVIHPPIEVRGDSPEQIVELMQRTRDAINSALPEPLRH
jgi:1-acyl-sn-glycerol-3-phosphate acyltransferase